MYNNLYNIYNVNPKNKSCDIKCHQPCIIYYSDKIIFSYHLVFNENKIKFCNCILYSCPQINTFQNQI